MKHRRRWFLAAVILVVLTATLWVLLARWRGPVVPVIELAQQDLVQTIVSSGRVIAAEEVSLGAERTGIIRQIFVDEGDRVRAGDPLLELDTETARADVVRARANVAAARAQLREVSRVTADVAAANVARAEAALAQARDTFRRTTTLADAGAVSEAERDAARHALAQAESQVASARAQAAASKQNGPARQRAQAMLQESQAALQGAEARLAQSTIRAPDRGIVLERRAEPGAVAQPGSVLFRLALSGPPQLLIQPDEKNLATLALGQKALASADAFPKESFAAVVTEIAPAIDLQRGTVDIKLAIPDPPPYLRPDMTVSVEVSTGRKDDALAVPLTGLRGREGGGLPWVFVIRDGHAFRQPVELGLEGEDAVQVTAGLRSGEQVVVAPEANLEAGQRVRPRERRKR